MWSSLSQRWHRLGPPVLRDVLRLVGGLLGAVAIGFVVFWAWRGAEFAVRTTGGVLQILGLAAVGWGVRRIRKQFKQPTVMERLLEALRNPEDVTSTIVPAVAVMTAGSLVSAVSEPVGATLEQRIETIEQEQKALRASLREQSDRHSAMHAALSKDLQAETRERTKAMEALRRLVEDVSAGGLVLERTGLIWLFAGVALSGFADKVAEFLSL